MVELETWQQYENWMRRAMAIARRAVVNTELEPGGLGDGRSDIPVGAFIVDPFGKILGEGENRRERDHDPTAHAEILALRQAAAAKGDWRLSDGILIVTLEPCPMCASAIRQARIRKVIYGVGDPVMGAAGTVMDLMAFGGKSLNLPQVEVIGGVLEEECRSQLQGFFQR